MAEDLDDGEFWLPSHFLTDDDILMDFDFKPERTPGQGLGLGSGSGSGTDSLSSNSDLELTSGSTETESDEDDHSVSGLARKMTRSNLHDSSPTCPVHTKGMVLSSSPQSTLCRCVCNQGSSRESMSGPVSPPKKGEKTDNATLDLLNKAAGEVARLKMKTDKTTTGTGFFDCSQKGILYPAPLRNPDPFPPLYFQPQFHHLPPMVWTPYTQPKQQPQNRATKNNNSQKKNSNNNNEKNGSNSRPLGLPPSAWPPLQLQAQNQAHVVPNGSVFGGPKRECAGTGVFLPRRVNTPNKSEGNTPKTKPVKGPQSHNRRNNNRTPPTTTANNNNNNNEIQLPQEWTY